MIKVKSTVLSLLSAGLIACVPLTASAETSSGSNDEVVIAEGQGWIVTAPKPGTEKVIQTNKNKFQPFSTPSLVSSESHSIASNSHGDFDHPNTYPYSSSTFGDESTANYSIEHNLIAADKFTTDGKLKAYWSGSNPFNATSITMQPKQTFNTESTSVTVSVGSPPGFTSSSSSATTSYPQIVVNNNYQGTYTWGPYTVSTSGHFTNITYDDFVTWLFGTNAYGQDTQTILNVSY